MAHPKHFPAGYYGKLPARGDFIARGLPPQFINPWDAWLQQALSASRELLKDDWLESYLSAPLWRFLLPPRLVMPQAVAGVICPSVDRIGRHFPFTIAAVLGTEALDAPATLARAKEWFTAAEEAALDGLAPTLDMEIYGGRVDELCFPGEYACPADAEASAVPERELHLHIALEGESCERALATLARGADPRASFALWLTEGSETIPDSALATAGLPSPDRFAALLDGRWSHHGWREASRPGGGSSRGDRGRRRSMRVSSSCSR